MLRVRFSVRPLLFLFLIRFISFFGNSQLYRSILFFQFAWDGEKELLFLLPPWILSFLSFLSFLFYGGGFKRGKLSLLFSPSVTNHFEPTGDGWVEGSTEVFSFLSLFFFFFFFSSFALLKGNFHSFSPLTTQQITKK